MEQRNKEMKQRGRRKSGIVLLLGLLVALVVSLTACSPEKETATLYDQGMAVVSLMEEMVKSETYGELFTSNEGIAEIGRKLAEGNYTEPEAVYEIVLPQPEELLSLSGQTDLLDGFSGNLEGYVINRLQSALPTQLNSLGGAEILAATSVYMAGRTFVSQELDQNKLYVYTFAEGYPVAVTFQAGEDHAVSATGSFLLGAESGDSDGERKALTAEELQEMLQMLYGEDCTVQKLEKKGK